MRDLTLGYQPPSLRLRPSLEGAIQRYEDALAAIPGATPVVTYAHGTEVDLRGYRFDRRTLPPNETAIVACLAQLAHDAQRTSG